MKYVFTLLMGFASVLGGMSQNTFADAYDLDDQHTSVVFSVSHFGYSYCYGMFGKYSGKFEYDPKNPTKSEFQFVIDVASLDTKSEKRDEHLRGPDFFNAKQFPDISFVSKQVTVNGEALDVVGDLTMRGVTKEIVLPLVYLGSGPAPDGKTHLGFTGKTVVKRSDFEMKAYLPNIGDEVTLILSFEGIR
jgi:polyisoprenoid-binding protein YceI